MRKLLLSIFTLVSVISCVNRPEESIITVDKNIPKAEYSVFLVADCGRNGSFEQKRVGEVLGVYAEQLEPEYVVQCGDMFHYSGVQSVNDPLFMTNFEQIYSHGELQCPWWGVLGNHEYKGNTQAIIDYTNVSRRWNVPERYYSKTFEGDEEKGLDSVMFVFIDTAPMIDKYHEEDGYPDARQQNPEKQIAWLDSTLTASNARWKIAIGHHPIYSYSKKSSKETAQMQERVAGIFKEHNVNASFAGHVHTFQHLQAPNEPTEYFVAPSASLGRAPHTGEFTKFTTEGEGFIVLGFNKDHFSVTMIDSNGKMKYTYDVK